MTDLLTPRLDLPYLAAAQSQKHVTVNESLRMLDALVQLSVLSEGVNSAPSTPAEGDAYIIGVSPIGDWSGQDRKIAAYRDGAWLFLVAEKGFVAYVQDAGILKVFDGNVWNSLAGGGGGLSNPTPTLGVNTNADTINRLSVRAESALFDAETSDHRLKVNKVAATDTASLILQTDHTGHAEVGLTGSDDLSVKVSADGLTWNEAILIDRSTAEVSFPNTALSGGGGSAVPDVIVEHRLPATSQSGTFSAGALRKRDMNTLVRNEAGIASLANNQVTLPAGTYYAQVICAAYAVNRHQATLWDVTANAAISSGPVEYGGAGGVTTNAVIVAPFTLTQSTVLEVRHECQTTRANNGFGVEPGSSLSGATIGVYLRFYVWKE